VIVDDTAGPSDVLIHFTDWYAINFFALSSNQNTTSIMQSSIISRIAKRASSSRGLQLLQQHHQQAAAAARRVPSQRWSTMASAVTAPAVAQHPQPCPGSSSTSDAAPGPVGSLFQRHTTTTTKKKLLHDLIGATGSIERTFGSNDNASGLLATGGSGLAAHASFDPNYLRAKQWITNHPVGNSVLSPIFLTGLTGALTEAAFPQAVITSQSIRQH
jgi:hypothetical protein